MVINYRNKLKQRGAVILTIVFILLGAISLLMLYTINSGVTGGRIIVNEYQVQQAFESAAAGLDYGVVYLQQNSASILVDSDDDGTINTNSISQALSNGSNFTVSFTNPIVDDFTLIKITASGTSANGNASKQMTRLVKLSSLGDYFPSLPFVSKGEIEVRGSALVRNLVSSTTIWSGDDIDFKGSGHTESNDGSGSSAKYTHTDIASGDNSLDNLSDDAFFENFFGASKEAIKSNASLYYSGDKHYYNSELDGIQNKMVWIDQTSGHAHISSHVQIGTQANPVILVVDGDLKISGSPTIYGFIYVTGDFKLSGNVQIHGGLIVNDEAELRGSSEVIYSDTVLDNIRKNIGVFSIVPGSWKDF